jgi:glycosyltransferase involved in cell wall biosynthesis
MGLASGLSALDGDEQYEFLSYEHSSEWLSPYLHGTCRLRFANPPIPSRGIRRTAYRAIKRAGLAHLADRAYASLAPVVLPECDPSLEQAGFGVMHFTLQWGFRTKIPSIFVPHDLQHLHLPGLFTHAERRQRRAYYRPLCEQARTVIALSRWGKEDLVRSLGVAADKVRVIGWASILAAYPQPSAADLRAVVERFLLPQDFAFFPAQTFKHKNHIQLLEALARLRDGGLEVPIVFSGHQNEHFEAIQRRARQLRLQGQVHALGFVTPLELGCLYRRCRMVVFPSRFEGFGMPLLEAFNAGAPVASSNATSLPELANGAALLFDPDNPLAITEAIRRLWLDTGLRSHLIARGLDRARLFSWDHVARSYRALYRLTGNRPLTEEDRRLLGDAL